MANWGLLLGLASYGVFVAAFIDAPLWAKLAGAAFVMNAISDRMMARKNTEAPKAPGVKVYIRRRARRKTA